MKNAFRLTIAAIVLVGLKVSAGDAIVFDVRKDFSVSENPNGRWSYGWFQSLKSPFQLHTSKGFIDAASTLFNWWTYLSPEGHPLPGVSFNASNAWVETPWGGLKEPGFLMLHPAFEYSVVRWSAPIWGMCVVTVTFSGVEGFGQPLSSDAHVLHNGVSAFDAIVAGESDEHSYVGIIAVAAGDIIDFAVGYGEDGTFHGDSTQLRATITLTSAEGIPPVITQQPASAEVFSGTTVKLNLQVVGQVPIAYQWRFNGTPLPAATTNLLTLSQVQIAEAGDYDVVVTNNYGSVTSRVAVLTVLFKPPEIVTQPTDQSVLSGASVSLSVLATGSLPITYQWERNGIALNDGGRISGANTADLSIRGVGIENVGVYSVVVANAFGEVQSMPVALDVVLTPPRIIGQPQRQAASLGSAVSLEVRVTGSQPLSFQWRCDGVDMVDGPRISGSQASTLQIANLSLSDLGSYSVVVSNSLGWVRSASVELTTWGSVLYVAVEASQLVVTWSDFGRGMTLQRTASLNDPNWEDVAESEATNAMRFAMTNAAAFFRLVILSPSDRLVWIPPGTFTMGSPTNEVDRYDDEDRQTAVTISRGYWMGKYEVTQGEYLAVTGINPSWFNGVHTNVWDPSCGCETNMDDGTDLSRPVEMVTWYDVTEYCVKLTERERLAGRIGTNSVYRLPTEAEWEYACRGWTSTRFSYGDDPGYTNLTDYAWYGDNSGRTTHPVGQKLPNPWGLYDMHGNVWEWCQDWYGDYAGGIALDPQGPASGSIRVSRGGCWISCSAWYDPGICRSAIRRYGLPDSRDSRLGFRILLAPGQP